MVRSKLFISIIKLDNNFREYIERNNEFTENKFVSLFELRNKGAKAILKSFFSFRKFDEVVIVFNDELFKMVEPLAYFLSLFTLKIKLYRILPDKKYEYVPLYTRFFAVFKLILSTVEIVYLKKKVFYDIKKNAGFKAHSLITEKSKLFYIKTNIGIGGKVGGSLGHISGVVNSLAKMVNLTFITSEQPVMINDNIKKKYVDLRKVTKSVPFELNRLKINSELIKQIDKLINRFSPDIIYQRLTLFDYSGAFLSNKYKIPLIVEYNGSEVWVQNNWGSGLKYSDIALRIEEYVLHSADTIITVSKVLQDELVERGFDKDKIIFYPNCIDNRIFDYKKFTDNEKEILRQKLGFVKEDKIFTFIGTFGAWHGVDFLARAIVKLVREHKDKLDRNRVKFLLIGDGLLGEKVREILNVNNTEKYVKLTGIVPQAEAPRYLSISDCFLSPHAKQEGRFIGSPTKLFEYMSFAKVIIASNLDQVGEIFDTKLYAGSLSKQTKIINEEAIVFEPGNMGEFIRSILFVANRNDLDKLGQNAYKMVMAKYTWDIHVDKIIGKYNEVVKK